MANYIVSGGTSSNITLNAGDTMTVEDGGVAVNTTVNPGATVTVDAGGRADNSNINGGTQNVEANGLANQSTVANGGTQNIDNGGFALGTNVNGGGTENVNDGGDAAGASVNDLGTQNVNDGGKTTFTKVQDGGDQEVNQGGKADATDVNGGTQTVQNGGKAYETKINPGGTLNTAPGATIVNPENDGGKISAGAETNFLGRLFFQPEPAGLNEGVVITSDPDPEDAVPQATLGFTAGNKLDFLNLPYAPGGTISWVANVLHVVENGTSFDLNISGPQLSSGATFHLAPDDFGGTIISLDVDAPVSSGQPATGGAVSLGALQDVLSGATALAATISSGGEQDVVSGGIARNVVALSGGVQYVLSGGTASGGLVIGGTTTILAGFEQVDAGGTANGITLVSGGLQNVSGTASGTTAGAFSTQVVYAGGTAIGTTVTSSGAQWVSSGGTASTTLVWGFEVVFSGGTALAAKVESGGVELINEGATASGITIDGGTVEIAVGGQASGGIVGGIVFDNGGTLEIDDATMPGNVISGFAPADTIDLLAVASSGGSATLGSGNVLDVVTSGQTYVLHLDPTQNFTGDTFTLSQDDGGFGDGTDITLNVPGKVVVTSGEALNVSSGQTSGGITVLGDGALNVSSGGTVSGTIDRGTETVLGHDVSATISGQQFVSSGGVASAPTVMSGGTIYVSAGGTAVGATISGGDLAGSSGTFGTGTITFAGVGGEFTILTSAMPGNALGGLAAGDAIDLAAVPFVSGGTASVTGSTLQVTEGGHTYALQLTSAPASGAFHLAPDISGNTLVALDQVTAVSSGQSVSNASAGVGILESVLSGGTAVATTIVNLGEQDVQSGGSASATMVSGGVQVVLGTASADVVLGGVETVLGVDSGAAVIGRQEETVVVVNGTGSLVTTIFGGQQVVHSGGDAVGTTLIGANQFVLSGGRTVGTIDAGNQYVSSGAVATGTVLTLSGLQFVYGTAISSIISSGGEVDVLQTSAVGTIVESGGVIFVDGGTAIGTTVLAGGTAIVDNTISATTIDGGYVSLLSDDQSEIPGGIAFGSGGGLLQILHLSSNTAPISGFAPRDFIDLQNVPFDSAGSATLVSGNVLQIVESGTTSILQLNPSENFGRDTFALASDFGVVGGSGTAITLVDPSAASAGQALIISSGHSGLIALAGGAVEVLSGGTASGTVVSSGGTLELFSGGTALAPNLGAGATLEIASGNTLNGYGVASGLALEVASGGAATGTTVSSGGTQFEYGNVRSTTVFGTDQVFSGGVANATSIDSGGEEDVVSGGTAAGATVSSGGFLEVFDSGVSLGTKVASGGEEDVYGSASGTTASGYQEVFGTVTGTTVASGGEQDVWSGGTAGGTFVSSGGALDVFDGGILGTTVNNGTVTYDIIGSNSFSGTLSGSGSLVVSSGGDLDVVSAYTGSAQVDDTSTLEFTSTYVGAVTFSGSSTGSGGTLQFDGGSTGPITVVNPNDTVIAQPGSNNWINSTVSYALPTNIDALFLYAGAQGTGNSDAAGDALYALDAGNTQTLTGNSANDTFVVNNSSDVVVPKAGSHDVVYSAVNYTLPTGVDALILEGSATHGVGNSDAVGDGLYAANPGQVATLAGNSANDTFVVYNSADVVVPKVGSHDVVYSAVSYTLPTGVDVLILEAGTQAVGNSDAAGDALYAADAGIVQTLTGNSPNDTFVVYNSADVVVPKTGSHDIVYSAVNYTLPTGVVSLILEAGTQAVGNSDAAGDTLYAANAGIAQTLTGHSHNDTFAVYNSGDTVIGQASSTDTVYAAANFTLPTNVDTLFLEGTASHGTGNSDAVNALYGNGGFASTLVAGSGADILYVTGTAGTILTGGAGHDTFAFPNVMGKDEVTNFGIAKDTLQFNATLFSNFTAAMNAASQVGANTVFTIDANDTVTLDNVTKTSLTAGNFHFT